MITYGSTTLTSYNTITKIEVYYYKSTSSTDLAGGSWSTTKPTWENGKYIWQKIRTTYEGKLANGQFYSESDPVNITGQQGATGTAAYSYKLNASDTIVGRTKTGQYTVNEITFTATYKQGTGAVTAYAGRFKIETTLNGTDWITAVSSTANESSKNFTIPENIIAIKCSLYQAGGLTVLLDIMTVPIVKDGVDAIGLRNTIPYYLASDKDTGVTRDEVGWSRYTPQLTADKKYLWVYYASRYSEGNSEPELIDIKDDVVSFENHGEISPSEECVVDINPVQDCNGYDKPWIAGGGVNKFNIDNIETVVGAYGLTTSIDGDVVRILGTYTGTGASSYRIIRHDQPIIKNAKFAVFRLDTSSILISCRYASTSDNSIVVEMSNVTPNTDVDVRFRFMIYTGSTAPVSYSPYSNICPITGWINIDINQRGKNWLQLPEYNEIKTYELQASYHKVPVKVLPNTDYYLHTEYLNDYTSKGKNNCYVLMTASPNGNTDWKAIGHSSNGIVDGVMHSTSDGYLFLKVYQSCSQEVYDELKNNCETMLAIGTTATAYEPYKKQDYIYDVRFDDNLSLIKTDNEPYQFRQNITPTAFQVDRLEDEIVGGSIVWNQLYRIRNASYTDKGLTAVASEDRSIFTINGTTTNYGGAFGMRVPNIKGHVYYMHGHLSDYTNLHFSSQSWGDDTGNGKIIKSTSENEMWYYVFYIKPSVGTVIENVTARPQVIDLTQMFGSTIADYIYNLEQNEAGAGIAWFRKYFPNEYYEYNAGEIKSVEELQSHDMVGFNIVNEPAHVGGYWETDGSYKNNQVDWSMSFGNVKWSVIPGMTYCFYMPNRVANNSTYYATVHVLLFDKNGNALNRVPVGTFSNNTTVLYTMPDDVYYIGVHLYRNTSTNPPFIESEGNNFCINLSRDGKRDGEYEPYINHSYPLDSSLILRGIPKLSSEGNLYYDGDRYKSDGTVTRKYGIVDLGTLNWSYQESFVRFTATTSLPQKALSKSANLICTKYEGNIKAYTDADRTDKIICTSGNGNGLLVRDSSYTDATSFKTAMSGVYLVYELATPTTEKGTPYQSLQTIDPYGTEEYVTNSIIPVGHETKYYSRAVYGGQLDMTNGILTVDRVRLTLTGDPTKEAWYLYSPDNYNADCFNIAIPNKKIGNSTSICDKFSNIITCWGANGDNKYGVYSDHPTLNRFYFRQPNADITTIDKWKEWLSENPVTVCYELADPIIYQLTPQELTMLAGQNYVYSDSGQTNIRYYDDQTSTEPRIDYTFMSAYDTAQMINNAVGTLEAPYTELEWVESTGKQYVYLDWKPPIKTWGFEADFICRNLIGSTGANVWNEETNANGYGSVFGVRNASQVNDCLLTSYASGVVRIGGGNIGDIGFERNKRIVMKMHGTTFTKPDGTTKTLTRLNETANKPYWNMTIFALHQGLRQAGYGSLVEPSSTRIYSLKFFDGDTLTVDLVGAIRKSDRITGLYDKVSKHFYPAPGMLYGNEVGDIGEIASIKQSMLKTNPQTIVVNKNRTRMWEATVPFDHLEDGQKLTVTYSYGNVVNSVETEKLAGWTDTSSNQQIYLKLTLSNGNQTDWIPCYYSNTGRLTTHYGSGIPIVFTYRENMLAGASETSSGYAVMRGFYADANYDSNTIYTQFASAVKAGTNGVKRYTLIMRDSDNTYSSFINQANTLGTTKTAYTGGFVLGKVYYSSGGAEYATGANTSSIWSTYQVDLRYDFNITTSGATALTLYKPVYLVGTVHDDDGLFYLDTTQWWTQTEPTSEDGKVYVFIGQAYSAYQSWLAVDNTAYQYYDGKFMPYETVRTLKSITTLQETLENQIDGKVETWCQINDPATAWTTVDLKNQHDGDLWYYIGESNTTYKNNTTYKYTASTGKWTAYSASTDLFDRIDSKSTVYYGKPSAITQNLEVGDYLVDNTDGCSYRWDGSKWVKLTDYKTAIDNIEIGGRNLLLNSATEKTGASNVGQWMQWAISDSPLVANEEYMLSFDAKMSNNTDVFYIGFALNSSTQEIMKQEVLVTDTYKRYTYKVKTTKTNINSIIISNAKSYGHGNANNSTGILNIKNIKLEKGNKATKWTPAPEDTENAIQSAQSKADEALTSANNKNKIYYSTSAPTGGTYIDGDTWFDTDDDNSVHIYNGSTKKWVKQQLGENAIADASISNAKIANATIQSAKIANLDGAKIVANTITANKLATDAIKSNNYSASSNTSSPYSAAGTFLDLATGNIYTPNFGVDSVNGGAYINGQVVASTGQIGDSAINYWQIGSHIDYNMNPSAAIIGHGTSFIQSGQWQISNNRINTQTYDDQNKITYLHHNSKYWDYGMQVPELDTTKSTYIDGVSNNWLYIRRSTADSIPALENNWEYLFRVDKDGTVYENGVKLSEKYASIDGVSGAYLPRTGGTITGNLTVNGTLTATASKANALTHTLSINGQSWSGSANLTINTLGVAYGGTGKTTGKDAANYFLNSLDTGSSTPVDGDYYISQYVSGGTTTTTYHRRPMSALWLYVKSKLSAADIYVPKTGGTFTGAVTMSDVLNADSITAGDLLVNGAARFNNGLRATNINGGQAIYTVIGTQTATTAAWTGELPINELYDGLTIAYYLPRTSANNVTLKLTLANGEETAAIPVYVTSTTRMTTHYGAGSTILLTYWSKGSVSVNGTATTEDRWTHGDYWDGNTIGEYGGSCIAGEHGMARYSLIIQTGHDVWESLVTTSTTATTKAKNSSGFLITSPILYQNGNTYVKGGIAGYSSCWSTGQNIDTRYSFNVSDTWSSNGRSLYLVGTISGDKFTLKDTTWWADELPETNDGYYYWYIGQMASAYTYTLHPVHPIYYYDDGIKVLNVGALTSSQVTNALGYTPYNATNPNGYTTNKGTVTSVRVQASAPLQSSTSTAQGTTLDTTISFANQNKNLVLASPSSGNAGAPTFRSLVSDDIPSLAWSKITSGNDDLKAIEALTGTSGFLKKTAANTWSLDTNTYLTTHQTVTDKNATLAWGAATTVATIGSTDIKVSLPSNPNNHYTANLITGASNSAKANATATNGNVFLNLIENSTVRNYHNLKGGNGLTVTSDANGVVTFTSPAAFTGVSFGDGKLTFTKSDGNTAEILTDDFVITQATGATGLVNSSGQGLSVGGATTKPVYFKNGVPTEITSIPYTLLTGAPTSMTPTAHTHGNIQNGGTLQTSDITVGNGDKIVVTDSSNSHKVARSSIAFDGSTKTQALTKAGTWETFNNYSLPLAASGTRGGVKIGYTSSGKNYAVQLSDEKMYVNVPWTDTTYSAGTGLSLSGTTFSNSGVTGVKGNSESNYRTGQVNLTCANIGAIPLDTNGNTQNLRRPLQMNGLGDNTLDAKINALRANRLAFLPADQIIIEKTTDGGATWVDAGVSDSTKIGLFSETRASVNIPLLNGVKNINCGLRITITAMKYDVPSGTAETAKYNYWNSDYVISAERYNQLKEMYFWVSSNTDTISIKVERASGGASTTWRTVFENTNYGMTGWSGNDYIRLSPGVFGGGISQTGNYWNYRLTFFTRGPGGSTTLSGTNSSSTQVISEIRGYGDAWWAAGNNYAANDCLYSHDYLKNATFPANVKATTFIGDLSGNATSATSATSATKATQDSDGHQINTTYLKLAGGTLTGVLTAKANQYTDSYSGALNMNNSNIYGVNSIYTGDASDNSQEGIHFYRSATTVDSLHAKAGVLYFTPNRTLGQVGTSYTVYHTGNKPSKSDVGLGNVDNTADANKVVKGVSAAAGTSNTYRHVWFSDSATETSRNNDADFTYNPNTNDLKVPSVTGITMNLSNWKIEQDSSTESLMFRYVG